MLKIPFGKHRQTGEFRDAGSVPNGLKCDCICIECGTALEAVHPKLPNRQNYFRHAANWNCKGGLESLFHQVAKQILKENNELQVSDHEIFNYTRCEIETPRYGKQPDAYISNNTSTLIVEVFFWHRIDQSTLDAYVNNGERVLEIDISGERKKLFDYELLKQLILKTAPREIYLLPSPKLPQDGSSGFPWWLFPLLLIGGLFWLLRGRKRRPKLGWPFSSRQRL